MIVGALAALPGGVVAPTSAAAAQPDWWPEEYDYPEVPSNDLPQASGPAGDEETAPAPVTDVPADVPEDAEGSATVDESWSRVPGTPVSVASGDSVETDEPAPDDGSADDDGLPFLPNLPGLPQDDALNETPDEGTTDPAPGEGAEQSPEETVPDGTEVQVEVLRPDDLAQGVTLIAVTAPESAVEPAPGDGGEGSDPDDGSTDPVPTDPASPSDLPTPSESPAPGELDESGSDARAPPGQAAAPANEATTTPEPTATPSESPSNDPTTEPAPTEAPTDAPTAEPSEEPVDAPGVGIRLSYEQFKNLFGADWSDRLEVRAYPACFATTPELSECAASVPVASVNDGPARLLEFVTASPDELTSIDPDQSSDPAPASARSSSAESSNDTASGASVVYAVAAEAKNFGETPFKTSSEWEVGAGTGEFTYSYPFELPAPVGGSAPELSLNYFSGSVDDLSTGQASEVGIGWADITPGFITRTFASCDDDEQVTPNSGNNEFAGRGDQCWTTRGNPNGFTADTAPPPEKVEEMFLTLNGRSSRLTKVRETTQGGGKREEFRLVDDPGWQIIRRSENTLGGPPFADSLRDENRERWIVRTPEGTEYWFGGRSGPTAGEGSAGSSQATLVTPVFGNHAGEDCHVPGNMADSWCPQAWRWNLDRVIDPVGNEIHYYYDAAVNRYDRYNGPPGSPPAQAAQQRYHRSSSLSRIEYGFRTSDTNPREVGGPARQVVELQTVARCHEGTVDPSFDTEPQTGVCFDGSGKPSSAQGAKWPDTPLDQLCDPGDTCTSTSPAFFSTRRLHKVVTFTQQGTAGALTKRRVASYLLGHLMPDASNAPRQIPTGAPPEGGIHTDLWLDYVEKQGHVADDPGETPANQKENLARVAFDGHAFYSRVKPTEDTRGGQLPQWRIFAVRNELGGRIDVDYDENRKLSDSDRPADRSAMWGTRPCSVDDVNRFARWNSDRDCFAIPDGDSDLTSARFDWHHRYLVVRVAMSDDSVGTRYDSPFDGLGPAQPVAKPAPNPGQVQVTEYQYDGLPAWRYSQSLNLPLDRESWTDWRGYEEVRTKELVVKDQLPAKDRPNPPAVVNESVTQIIRFRGMDGSRKNATDRSEKISESITTTDGGTEPDSRWLNGLVAETILMRGGGGEQVDLIERNYTQYGVINTLQERELQPFNARYVFPRRSLSTEQLRNQYDARTGTRQHEVITTVNNGGTNRRDVRLGAVEAVWDRGDLSTASDDKCALTRYRSQETPEPTVGERDELLNDWIRRPYLNTLHSGSCANAAIDDANQVSRTETFYDYAEDGTDPTGSTASLTEGLPTRTVTATDASNGKTAGVDANGVRSGDGSVVVDNDYDAYGRTTTATDPNGNITRTAYNGDNFGAAGDVLTRMRVTQEQDSPKPDLSTTTVMEPQGGLPLRVVEPNGETTNVSYDGLGRTRRVWLPNQPRYQANGAELTPSLAYTYLTRLRGSRGDDITQDQPSRITTGTLAEFTPVGGGVFQEASDFTHAFYDGWGREIQTDSIRPNAAASEAQRIVVSTSYDHRGLMWRQTGAYSSGNPAPRDPKIVNPNFEPTFGTVATPRFTTTTYDAAQRPIAMDERTGATRFRITQIAHLGNATVIDEPGKGQSRSSFDVWDRPTTAVLSADPPKDANLRPLSDPVDIDTATYTYNTRGELETITKTPPGRNPAPVWDYDYDWAGRQTAALDPDTGLTLSEYDPASNLTATTTFAGRDTNGAPTGLADARITTAYDQLNRPLARYDATNAPDGGTPANPGLELARWTYDTRPGRTLPGQPADTTPLPCNNPNQYAFANDDPLMLGRLASVTTTIRPEGDNTGLAAPIGAESPWKIIQDTCGYDGNGNPRGEFTTYPTWLTNEQPNVDANNDGNVEAVAHGSRTDYNKRDMPTLRSWTPMPGQPSFAVNFSYLTDDHLNAVTQGSGTTGQTLAEAVYTPIGQTSSLTSYNAVRGSNGQASPTAILERAYTWEPASERLSTVVGTQAGTNNSNRIQRLGLLYEYDEADNPTRITNGVQSTSGGTTLFASWCQTYDSINRLRTSLNGSTVSGTGNGQACTKPTTSAAINQVRALTGQLYDLGYTYSGGRIENVLTPGAAVDPAVATPTATRAHSYTEPNAPHRTSAISNQGTGSSPGLPPAGLFAWDEQGRATAAPGGRTYGYDRQGQLISSVGIAKTGPTTGVSTTSTYAHTADGLRFARRTGTTTTVWLGNVEITRDTSTTAGRISTSHHITTPDGVPIATRYGEVVTAGTAQPEVGWNWAVTDAQNTIRLSRRADGAYPSHHYMPYGEPNSNAAAGNEFVYHATDRGYLDKSHDKILGDIRLDHRTFTPNLNSLTSPDPLFDRADPLTINPYTYSRNNPFALSDPSGLMYRPDGFGESGPGGTTPSTPPSEGTEPDQSSYFDEPSSPIGAGDSNGAGPTPPGVVARPGLELAVPILTCMNGPSASRGYRCGTFSRALGGVFSSGNLRGFSLGQLAHTRYLTAVKNVATSSNAKNVLIGRSPLTPSPASRLAANQAAGNAARDALARSRPGALTEQTFRTPAGARRVDVLTRTGLAIESKVGRTSLTSSIRSQIVKDQSLLMNRQVTGVEWVFSRSAVTGKIGPSPALQGALSRAGIRWSLSP